MPSDYWSNGKIQQIGRGVKVASVQQMFTQGSFMNSAQDTDMAITGEGFFQVRDRVTNELMYTRAGNFTFDANGLLETPAGYVLQGWELSIPKPGQEPVRIGMPVDVKVIALNAPPVETGQIKVVANLNADDSSAYIYSQSAWAGLYADQLAVGPAESARQAAIEATYSYALNSADYPNSSKAFETAFENWMVANGYFESAGTIYKTISPSPSEISTAAKAASASAWTILAITGDGTSPYYPITVGHVSGQAYAIAYNDAYHDYMIGQGFTEDPQGKFYIKTVTPLSSTSSAADLADQAGKLAVGLPYSYPSGDPAKDATYATAYSNFLTSYSSLIQKPADIHYRNPGAGEITNAKNSGDTAATATSATYGGYTTAALEENLAYLAAYTEELTDSNGTTYVLAYPNPLRLDMTADFASPPPIASDIAIATPAALAAARAIDSNFASYPGTNEAANIAYVKALLFGSTGLVSNQGFSLNPSFTLPALPTDANFTKEPESGDLIAANTSGITAAKNVGAASNYTYPMGETAWDNAYLSEYNATLNARGYTQTVPSVTGFKIVNSREPSVTDINNARDHAKSTAASVIGSNLGYPYPSTALLSVFQNTYNAEYVNQMTNVLGYVNNSGVFTKSQPATGTEIAAGQAAARTLAELEAKNAGQLAYDAQYQLIYQSAVASISGQFAPWQLEGNGFAGAWDGTDLSSPIDPENYTHANPWTIYDSLGTAHTLMVYYQPNPEMEN
ncbi:MAG: flagellar hook-basal body complex protein, partial [Deltaproteobacteria bacterium]|nr:flagellar hook-basal body complex protein [Deltaproteobacteria bacterium]